LIGIVLSANKHVSRRSSNGRFLLQYWFAAAITLVVAVRCVVVVVVVVVAVAVFVSFFWVFLCFVFVIQ